MIKEQLEILYDKLDAVYEDYIQMSRKYAKLALKLKTKEGFYYLDVVQNPPKYESIIGYQPKRISLTENYRTSAVQQIPEIQTLTVEKIELELDLDALRLEIEKTKLKIEILKIMEEKINV